MTTSAHSSHSQDQLKLFAEDFPARTSARPALALGSVRAPAQGCSLNSCVSFAWWDRDSWSWRTSQRSLIEGWTSFSENWPKQGLMRNGLVYRRVLWAPATAGTAGGALPTPTTQEYKRRGPNSKQQGLSNTENWLPQILPTLRASDPEKRGNFDPHDPRNGLPAAVGLLPTPAACVANDGERPETWLARRERVKAKGINGNGMGMPLTIAAQLLTPCANDWKGRTNWEAAGRHSQQRLPDCLPTGPGTHLNPSFVEEMMGFPVGWTA